MSLETKKIRQFKCNSCGGEIELHNQRTKFVSCPYCGSVSDASSDAYKVLTQNVNPAKFPAMSFLKLGMTGVFSEKTYKVIGRTRWRNEYKEYWSGEDGSGYSDETWVFDEWLLLSEDASYLSLVESGDGFKFSRSFIPKFPILPKKTIIPDFYSAGNSRVKEYGYSTILHFEGESTYQVNPGDYVGFSMYTKGKTEYTAEWRFDNNKEVKEIEFFVDSPVSTKKIMEAFKNDESVSEKLEEYGKIAKRRQINKRIFLFGGILNFMLGVILAIAFGNSNYNQLYFENFKTNNTQGRWVSSSDTTKALTLEGTKMFSLQPDYCSVNIYMSTTAPEDNFKGMYKLIISDKKDNIIYESSVFNYNYKKLSGGKEAHHTGNISDYLDINELTGEFKVKTVFEIPKDYKLTKFPNIDSTVTISTYGSQKDYSILSIIGGIFIVISLFIRKPKL